MACTDNKPTQDPSASPAPPSSVAVQPTDPSPTPAPAKAAVDAGSANVATRSRSTVPGRVDKELRFPKGQSSATLKDAVIRGERHWIEFGANADQQLDVTISSIEDNAVFGLYVVSPYGWQDRLNGEDNVAFLDIEVEPKAGVVGTDTERTSWSGKLPYGSKSGKNSVYAIEVGGTRGNATYTLNVSIR